MSSGNNRLNRLRKQPKSRSFRHDGKTLWDIRPAGSVPYSETPDWMMVPDEIVRRMGGPKKRRIVRQWMEPCPVTGNLVPARELEGGVYCWESPGQGWFFRNRLGPVTEDTVRIDGGEGPD